jgi:hypothetical protein
MSREAFTHLLHLIGDDPVFISTSGRPQHPVHYQLAAFLCYVGAEDALKAASVICVCEGTVYGYRERVCRALRNIQDAHLAWPGPARREYLNSAMSEWGFPGCIGIGDGTLIRLVNKPLRNGWAYWCRKKFYAVQSSHLSHFVAQTEFYLVRDAGNLRPQGYLHCLRVGLAWICG